MRRSILFSFWLVVALALPAAAQQTVFLVRHAERADTQGGAPATMATDPDLSESGKARAQYLATALKDAGITAIFVTPFKRTQQTAEPLAKALGIHPTVVDSKDTLGLVEKVKSAGGNVLVVGHSNSVPDVIGRLGVETPLKIADTEYDNLFIVVRSEKPHLVRVRFR
jgi:phosphohistidine phosphatase SixA